MDQQQPAQTVGLNLANYLADKAAGIANIVKLNGVAHYSKRMFNPTTGAPTPVLIPVDALAVQAALDQANAGVKTFTALLQDIEAAPEKLDASKA